MKNRFVAVVAIGVATTVAMPDVAHAAEVDHGAANHIVTRVNEERANHGLHPLALRGDVSEVALGHSNDMASRGTIWHNDAYFSHRARFNARTMGENVALNGDIENAHQRLMNSPAHRANILDARFDTIGIGVVREGNALYVTQNFVDTNEAAQAAPAKATKAKVTKAKKTKATKAKSRKARRAVRRR